MKTQRIVYLHILIAFFVAIIQYFCMKPLLDVQDQVMIVDAMFSGVIVSILLLLLSNISKYSHLSILTAQQRFINLGALAILFVICWLGSEFFILYILISADDLNTLSSSLPMRILIALLSYSLSILIFSRASNPSFEEYPDVIDENDENAVAQNSRTEEIEILERIAVKNGQKIDVILVPEIIHLQAEGDYVMIHSTKGKFLKEQTMKSFESCLPQDKFVRVHRSSIINIEFIAQIELYDKQSQLLKLKNGAQVKISLSGYKALKKTLGL